AGHGVTGRRDDLTVTDREGRVAFEHHPGLGVRMPVQARPLPGLIVDVEVRDGGAVLGALELPALAGAETDLRRLDERRLGECVDHVALLTFAPRSRCLLSLCRCPPPRRRVSI